MQKSVYKTKQLDFLMSYIKENQGRHFTAEEVRSHFEAKQIPIGIATIYRQLEKLVADGTLQKYFIDEHSAACFEYAGENCKAETPHFHLKCEACGNLFHIECDEIQELSEHLSKEHGFNLNPFRTVLYGICGACKKSAKILMLFIVLIFTARTSVFAKNKIKVISTIFPMYDWTRQIIGEQKSTNESIDLTLLAGNGVDLHSYQPSIQDIAKISTADIFIFVGGESDSWVKEALKNARNKKMIAINLMELLNDKLKQEEIVEGMEAEACDDDEDEDEIEYDEHVWLSVKNAQFLCGHIGAALCQQDVENQQFYKENLADYLVTLGKLDNDFKKTISSAGKNTLIFGDRFPFRYLVDDYGLNYYAAFVGCSAETEASFKTVIFLAEKMRELNQNCIMKLETSDGKLAATIAQTSKLKNTKILTLNSMQSVSTSQASKTSYIKIMNDNLNTIKQALE